MDRPEPGDFRPPSAPRAELERPPGDRYRSPSGDAAGSGDRGPIRASPARGIALAVVVGVVGAILATQLEGILALTLGLLVVAALIGRFVALALSAGAGNTIPARRRLMVALAIALGAVTLAQLGIWLYARSEGGALGLVDYLAQAFGPLVPLQFIVAGAVAWWSVR
ncbi:MAG: hypothetical protein M3067_15305 [Chloroflexota bacterium]|nr:hypothetical protein [Chloroflexota bacterium]